MRQLCRPLESQTANRRGGTLQSKLALTTHCLVVALAERTGIHFSINECGHSRFSVTAPRICKAPTLAF